MLHLVASADPALRAQEAPGLFQLLDGFGMSGSKLLNGVFHAGARFLLRLPQEAQIAAPLGFTGLIDDVTDKRRDMRLNLGCV